MTFEKDLIFSKNGKELKYEEKDINILVHLIKYQGYTIRDLSLGWCPRGV